MEGEEGRKEEGRWCEREGRTLKMCVQCKWTRDKGGRDDVHCVCVIWGREREGKMKKEEVERRARENER